MMRIEIYIAPHERAEACEAYRQWLTDRQIAAIKDAEEEAVITLIRDTVTKKCELLVDPWAGL